MDHIVSLTGYTGDAGLYRQLQVHECYATAAPGATDKSHDIATIACISYLAAIVSFFG